MATGQKIGCATKALLVKMGEMPVREKASFATSELVKSVITARCISTLLNLYRTAGSELALCMKAVNSNPALRTLSPCPPIATLAANAVDRTSAFAAVAATVAETEGSTVANTATKTIEQATKVAQKLPRRVTYVLHNERGLINVFNRHSAPIPLTQRCTDITKLSHVKITPEFLKHVTGIQLTETFKASGNIKTKISGFHVCRKNKMRKYLRNIKVHPETGVVQADIYYMGIVKPDNTFFPSSWTDDKILRKIKEALANQVKDPLMQKNGRWLFTGMTHEKITIEMVIEKTGEFVTAYPPFGN